MSHPSWHRATGRIDAMSLRERCVLFLCAAFVVAAAVQVLVLGPTLDEQKQLAARMKRNNDELAELRARLSAATQPAAPGSPLARLRGAVEQARAEQSALEAAIARLDIPADARARLPALLERLLARQQRLVLRKLVTVDDRAAAPSPSAAASAATGRVRWQVVELSLAGPYVDLMQHLAQLEQALPELRWEALTLDGPAVAGDPSTLGLRVSMAGVGP